MQVFAGDAPHSIAQRDVLSITRGEQHHTQPSAHTEVKVQCWRRWARAGSGTSVERGSGAEWKMSVIRKEMDYSFDGGECEPAQCRALLEECKPSK